MKIMPECRDNTTFDWLWLSLCCRLSVYRIDTMYLMQCCNWLCQKKKIIRNELNLNLIICTCLFWVWCDLNGKDADIACAYNMKTRSVTITFLLPKLVVGALLFKKIWDNTICYLYKTITVSFAKSYLDEYNCILSVKDLLKLLSNFQSVFALIWMIRSFLSMICVSLYRPTLKQKHIFGWRLYDCWKSIFNLF